MVDRTRNRSDNYQSLFCELCCSPEILNEVANSEGIYSKLNPFGYNEEFFELKEQLRMAFWRIVDKELTKRQKQVIKMTSEGMTQMEIAKKLQVNQSSIAKSISGNVEYLNGGKKRNYGGAKKRIKRAAETDPEVLEILAKLADLQDL
jgi:DNA-binding CsgD family transcriptional regulator